MKRPMDTMKTDIVMTDYRKGNIELILQKGLNCEKSNILTLLTDCIMFVSVLGLTH